jgi:CBS domain-containing protein
LLLGISLAIDPAYHFEQGGRFWEKLMVWNLMMVAFNLIPAFPMDGGRVLRAFLAMIMDYGRATRWAATVGQGIALVAALWMLLSGHVSPVLLLIAFFIFMAAGQEAAAVTQRQAADGLQVRDAMLTDFRSLSPDATLRDAVDLLLSGAQQDFPMLSSQGELLGLVTRHRLIQALSEHGSTHPAHGILEPCDSHVQGLMSLGEALERLQASASPAMPVLDPVTGRLVGLLTTENIGELMMVRAALRRQAGA